MFDSWCEEPSIRLTRIDTDMKEVRATDTQGDPEPRSLRRTNTGLTASPKRGADKSSMETSSRYNAGAWGAIETSQQAPAATSYARVGPVQDMETQGNRDQLLSPSTTSCRAPRHGTQPRPDKFTNELSTEPIEQAVEKARSVPRRAIKQHHPTI